MIKSLIRLALVVVIGVLVYNYFLGSPSEKESASKIFNEVKEVGSSVADLLRSEKEKFDAGKYDTALEKVGGLFDKLKTGVDNLSSEQEGEISNLDAERKELEERLKDLESQGEDADSSKTENLREDLDKFMERTKRMIEGIESVN
ncbi:MAG: hypothetical protein GYB31_17850 [Bacteroidetes bacterium]|nr:hypothetical protein [Bacteroidota bacterium]